MKLIQCSNWISTLTLTMTDEYMIVNTYTYYKHQGSLTNDSSVISLSLVHKHLTFHISPHHQSVAECTE